MDRRERERILGEWGVGYETIRQTRERDALARDLEGSPVKGRPTRQRLRGGPAAADSYVASLGGPLPYMQRLRRIEEETAEHERRLGEAWRDLAHECAGDPAEFARRWRRAAERWNFFGVNDLIDRHNRYYPAEARLPMNPRTGDFALVGGKPYRREPLGAGWALDRCPPALDEALRRDRAA